MHSSGFEKVAKELDEVQQTVTWISVPSGISQPGQPNITTS